MRPGTHNAITDVDGIRVGIYHPGWVMTDMGGAHANVSVADARAPARPTCSTR